MSELARRSRGGAFAGLALAMSLAALVYLPGLPGDFVYDDYRLIVDNDGLKRPFDPSRAFLRDYYASDVDATALGYYRPIAILSNEWDYRIAGGRSLPFHATNIAVHVLATALVFALARLLAKGSALAATSAGVLFALHPSHAESVAFISGRVDPLAGAFVLAVVTCHLIADRSDRPWRWRAAAAGAWLGGLLSKEMAVTAPLLAFVVESGVDGWPSSWRAWAERARRFLLYVPVALLYLALRTAALHGLLAPPTGGAASLSQPIVALGTYLRWLVLPPWGLDLEPAPEGGRWLALAIASIVVTAAGLWGLARRALRVELAAGAAAIVALAPVLQLRTIETALSERFLYLPSAFAMIVIGLLVARPTGSTRRAAIGAVVLLAAVYAAVLAPRALAWRDEVALWTAKDREDGGSLKARLNLGRAFHRRGDDAAARRAYESAIALAPGVEPVVRGEMSSVLSSASQGDRVDDLRRAIAASPLDGSLWANLGFLEFERGDLAGATSAFDRAIDLSPLRADAWLGAALAKLRAGDAAGAETAAARAMTLNPALSLAAAIRAECLFRLGRPCESKALAAGLQLDDPQQQAALVRLRAAAQAACP